MRVLQSSVDDGLTALSWDAMVAQDPRGHLLQTWAWGDLKSAFGWRAIRTAIVQDGSPVAGAQTLYRRLGPFSVAYIPKGPVLLEDDPAVSNALWEALRTQARAHRSAWVICEPEWYDQETDKRAWLTSRGLEPTHLTVQPRRTIVVDLAPSEEDLLAAMKPKWRYNIRLSMRRGVEVKQVGVGGIDTFFELMRITGQRDEFGIHTKDYYRTALELFLPQTRTALFVATYEGRALAALMPFAFNGQAWYMYGASSNEHRELMPNHQLQWRAMLWAKSLGCTTYDLWGIPDAEPEKEGKQVELSGVGRFKAGFGGRVVRYVGAYVDVLSRPIYKLAMLAQRLRA
ncbi:MAG: lipid II:glycine glycyltransferase FemX [Anaerolineae bacterium]